MAFSASAWSLTGVNPVGVNVNATGVTTVFITFQGLTPTEQPAEAFWCGDIGSNTPNTVTSSNPCTPGTLFGNLPAQNNFARPSGTGGASNLTDIMTIPASVARRAYQSARRGEPSLFFYVRRFVDGANESFVAVTCALTSGGAGNPLALTEVTVSFDTAKRGQPLFVIKPKAKAPPLSARIHYNGSGHVKGRWEVVLPGDPPPTADDLLPEASLPIEQRSGQRRYTELGRFDIFLPPTGEAVIPGPPPKRIPTDIEGPYLIVLRIEATADKEGDSDTTAGFVQSGGVAGFPMPVLRYYVGVPDQLTEAAQAGEPTLLAPKPKDRFAATSKITFTWLDGLDVPLYRLEIQAGGQPILNAVVPAGVGRYDAPSWLAQRASGTLRWRVIAQDQRGALLRPSEWREFELTP